ncbi:SPOR domain-containing protein [Flammeovirgaceae bacterium SG7u.111]|nr:SPOR domain-containing protein [Flammeovirgaceae bacterium SG7u.132]WPO38598.1 SPOR domain-containing protein [Flammeovirgaceae bacterium SG7u.111]
MITKKIYFLLLSFTLAFSSLSAQSDHYLFFDGTYEQLQTRALNSDSPYFVFVYANWSLQAKKMYENTFTSPEFIKYAESKWIGMDLDGESIITAGSAITEKYQLIFFPTVLFFTPEGKYLGRLPGYKSPAELIAKMKELENEKGAPELALDLSDEQPQAVQKPGEYLFKVDAKLLDRTGYGVQIGVFSNYRNVFTKILELQNKKYHKNVSVFIKDMGDGQLSYKVILGPVPDKKIAENYLGALKKKDATYYANSILVDLKDL